MFQSRVMKMFPWPRPVKWNGGLLGLLFAKGGLWLLKATLPADMPRLMDVRLDWRVLVSTGALAILTGFFFGLAPAQQFSRIAPVESLKSGGRSAAISVSQRLRGTLAVAEVGFAVMLVLSAGIVDPQFLGDVAHRSWIQGGGFVNGAHHAQ
jgi:hypothetical protein